MKFLIQKINNQIVHDFSFTLLESIKFQNWLQDEKAISYRFLNCNDDNVWFFKDFHQHYVPVGSVEFVLSWFKRFGIDEPRPVNIPEELNEPFHTKRLIKNGNYMDIENLVHGKWFVKSADKIKGLAEVLRIDDNHIWKIPAGNYQMSEYINIDSEWRAFVYQGKLVALQNYSGDYTKFPDIESILWMIHRYKSAPIAYTLDVGVNGRDTFIIEAHDFFSCELYGFANHKIYPYMLYRWFQQYLKKNN